MLQSLALQHFAGRDQTHGIETELGVLTAAGRPFARARAVQTDPDSNHRLDPDFPGCPNGLFQFFQLLDYDDDELAQFAPEKRDSNKCRILVTITDDQTLR